MDYQEKRKLILLENKELMKLFEQDLYQEKLKEKTIRRHLFNVDQ